eukprot:jgi/Psemu1/41580/gm1.41580_g
MPPTAFDWNQIQDIAIQFGTFNAKDNAHKHEVLNQAFAHCLEYMDSLFITDDDAKGPKTLAPDPVTMLREIIVNAIMDIIPSRERTAVNKTHISRLLADATFWYVAPNQSTKRLRNKHSMDKAGELAITNGQDTIFIEIRATHWGFKPDWDAIHFGEIYDTNIYSFPDATQNRYGKSNTRKATPVANKTPNASRTKFAHLQQQKYVTPKAVPLQRTHISPTARIPPVSADLGPLQSVGPIADTPSVKAPQYSGTWTYSPNSDSVSFHRVRSNFISFGRSTSSSSCRVRCQETSNMTPIQCHDKSTVPAPHVTPSTLPSSNHLFAPPWGPTDLGWTFNPQTEIATFRRVPKSVPSPQPPMCNRLRPPETLAEDTDLPHAAPAYIRSLRSPCRNQPVLRLTKRHRDALTIQMYHLYANILSMNWFYDTRRDRRAADVERLPSNLPTKKSTRLNLTILILQSVH